jgi:hypothetical protein
MPAEAKIRDIFNLTARGTVLVLENGITAGKARVGDTVSTTRGQAMVLAFEFADPGGYLCVRINTPDTKEVFRAGDAIHFTDPLESATS